MMVKREPTGTKEGIVMAAEGVERLEVLAGEEKRQLKNILRRTKRTEEKAPGLSKIARTLAEKDWFALFVYRDGKGVIRGFTSARVDKYPEGNVGWSGWICTDPRHRSPSMAKALMRTKIEWVLEREPVRVVAEGATKNGQGLLKYFGFEAHPKKGWDEAILNVERFLARTRKNKA